MDRLTDLTDGLLDSGIVVYIDNGLFVLRNQHGHEITFGTIDFKRQVFSLTYENLVEDGFDDVQIDDVRNWLQDFDLDEE